jgi:uncharacterized surface protein with fasciclin (FAS1) repeats
MLSTVLILSQFYVSSAQSIAETADATPDLSTLDSAIKAASFDFFLSQPGNFTVFAPTNEAFAKLAASTLDNLLEPVNVGDLRQLLWYHMLSSRVRADDVKNGEEFTTLYPNTKIIASISQGVFKINTANVVSSDIECSNGIIYMIDTVLQVSPA